MCLRTRPLGLRFKKILWNGPLTPWVSAGFAWYQNELGLPYLDSYNQEQSRICTALSVDCRYDQATSITNSLGMVWSLGAQIWFTRDVRLLMAMNYRAMNAVMTHERTCYGANCSLSRELWEDKLDLSGFEYQFGLQWEYD